MRLALVIDGLRCGGKERQFAELAKGLVRGGYIRQQDLLAIALDGPGFFGNSITESGPTLECLCRRGRWDLGALHRLRENLRGFQPDVAHSFGLLTSLVAAPRRRAAWALVDESIQDAMPPAGMKARILQRLSIRMATLVVANSSAGLLSKQVPAEKGRVLYNGLDRSRFVRVTRREEVRAAMGWGDRTVIGMVASLTPAKDWGMYVSVAVEVMKANPDVVFVAAGDGPLRPKIERHAGGSVKFFGNIDPIEDMIGACDIVVLCTDPAYALDGIPNALAEAMALGRPVIGTNGGGTPELVENGVSGFLVPPRDARAMSAKILDLLDHPALARRLGEAGKKRIEQDFTIERCCQTAMGIYREAMERVRGA